MNNKALISVVVCAAIWSNGIQAKIIEGVVKNSEGNPLSQIQLEIRGTEHKAITANDGSFTMDLPIGEYTLDVKGGANAHFHQSISVIDDEQQALIVTLEDEPEHKLVIRANPLEHTSIDMATPTTIISGEELIMKRAATLGEILQLEPGLSVSSFGPAVARPVIRGLGGARVQIANNQMIVQDASTTSADHDVGIEPLLAEQIEVIKGPATLLYGSGAIGGIVNVTDRKISSDFQEELSGGIEIRLGNSTTDEKSLVFSLDGGSANWNWHIDGYKNDSNSLKIPGSAESEILHESEQGGAGSEGTPEEEMEGVLENSFAETTGGSLGLTYVTDWGHIGASINQIDKLYGVPGHHEEEEVILIEPAAEEGVSIDMLQTRYDLQAQYDNSFGNFSQWFIGYSLTDYEHVELEGDETGTQFDNEAWELKSFVKHDSWQGWVGVWGIQFAQRDFEAIGDEAFIPPSKTKNQSIFFIEEKAFGDLKWELGLRYESQQITTDTFPEFDESGISFSSGLVYSLGKHNKIAFNYSRASRLASVEELLSEGPHLATQSYEIGNINLAKETSNNLDLSYRFEIEKLTGEVNLYWNQFSDFIYGEVVTSSDPCVSADAAIEAADQELQIVCYRQQNADFSGIEMQLEYLLGEISGHEFKLGLIADSTRAELDNGDDVPRIPPLKYGINLQHDYDAFSSQLSFTQFNDQDRVGNAELPTDGFKIVDLEFAYRIPFQENELFLFLKGKNLLDEEARDHASFLKDLAPRAGRSFVAGMRYTF